MFCCDEFEFTGANNRCVWVGALPSELGVVSIICKLIYYLRWFKTIIGVKPNRRRTSALLRNRRRCLYSPTTNDLCIFLSPKFRLFLQRVERVREASATSSNICVVVRRKISICYFLASLVGETNTTYPFLIETMKGDRNTLLFLLFSRSLFGNRKQCRNSNKWN